jgi:hypothetical protein
VNEAENKDSEGEPSPRMNRRKIEKQTPAV